jgi:hypothetical protein
MHYRVIHTDRRHNWHRHFRYIIEFVPNYPGSGVLDFDRALKWFNRTWGWSTDVDLAMRVKESADMVELGQRINPHWAYSGQYRKYRIYVQGDQELAMFQLVHSGR